MRGLVLRTGGDASLGRIDGSRHAALAAEPERLQAENAPPLRLLGMTSQQAKDRLFPFQELLPSRRGRQAFAAALFTPFNERTRNRSQSRERQVH